VLEHGLRTISTEYMATVCYTNDRQFCSAFQVVALERRMFGSHFYCIAKKLTNESHLLFTILMENILRVNCTVDIPCSHRTISVDLPCTVDEVDQFVLVLDFPLYQHELVFQLLKRDGE
jgi:hypothetical protein